MERRPIKFIWGSSDQIKGHWRFGVVGFYDRHPGFRYSGIAISGRGVLRWVAGLTLAGYLSAASALYLHYRRNPYNEITPGDTVVLPLRWQKVREKRGRMLIAEGLADLQARRWAEAGMKLRGGLSRAPHDPRARLALAQFYVAANRPANALTVLTEDLGHVYPGRPYLEYLFAVATESEDYAVIVATCDRLEPEVADRRWRTNQKVLALLRADRAAEVLALTAKVDDRPEWAREARVVAWLALKRPAEALDELARWQEQPGANLLAILRLQVRAAREAGKWAEMDAATEKFRRAAPSDPRIYSYIVAQQWLAGRPEAARETLEEYFRRFSSSAENLLIAVQTAGEAKAGALVQRCADEAAAHGFDSRAFKLALGRAELAAGDWRAASRTLEALPKVADGSYSNEAVALDWMTRLLAVVTRPDEAPQAGLLEFFQQRPRPMRVYRESCELLMQAGRYATAGELLGLAERAFPGSPTLGGLRRQVEAGLKSASAPAAPAEAPVALAPRSEKTFFAEVAAAEQGRRWTEAADLIRAVRVEKPGWLDAREADVLELQLRVAAQTGDAPEMLAAAKLLLDGSNARASRLLALAREFGEAGRQTDGERLLREVLRRNPDFPPAIRLQAEWRPKPTAEKPAGVPPVEAARRDHEGE